MLAPIPYPLPKGKVRVSTQISAEVLSVLREAEVTEINGLPALKLCSGQLERKLYKNVNEVLARLEGKWKGGRISAHLFPVHVPLADLLQVVIETGQMPPKNPLAYYPTPDDVIRRMMGYMSLCMPPNVVLEPSAGTGSLVTAVKEQWSYAAVTAVEMDPVRAVALRRNTAEWPDVTVHEADFLVWGKEALASGVRFDGVLMNPPFSINSKQMWVDHVNLAYSLLERDSALVAIVPPGIKFNEQKNIAALRQLVKDCGEGEIEELPANAFEEAGTNMNICILYLRKPEQEKEPSLPPARVLANGWEQIALV